MTNEQLDARAQVNRFGTRTLYLTARHVSPKYNFNREPFKVSATLIGENLDRVAYYASGVLGCSKNYSSPARALHAMASEHACNMISIHEADGSHASHAAPLTPAQEAAAARAEARRTLLVRGRSIDGTVYALAFGWTSNREEALRFNPEDAAARIDWQRERNALIDPEERVGRLAMVPAAPQHDSHVRTAFDRMAAAWDSDLDREAAAAHYNATRGERLASYIASAREAAEREAAAGGPVAAPQSPEAAARSAFTPRNPPRRDFRPMGLHRVAALAALDAFRGR